MHHPQQQCRVLIRDAISTYAKRLATSALFPLKHQVRNIADQQTAIEECGEWCCDFFEGHAVVVVGRK